MALKTGQGLRRSHPPSESLLTKLIKLPSLMKKNLNHTLNIFKIKNSQTRVILTSPLTHGVSGMSTENMKALLIKSFK